MEAGLPAAIRDVNVIMPSAARVCPDTETLPPRFAYDTPFPANVNSAAPAIAEAMQ